MRNGKKRGLDIFATSLLLAASALAAAPALAKKPPPPPPPPPPGEWEGCTPWGPVIYGVDCCDYPELVVPCEARSPDQPLRPEEARSDSAGR
jgi:hypothetical protein